MGSWWRRDARRPQGGGGQSPRLRRSAQSHAGRRSVLTGARALSEELGTKLEKATPADLGSAERATITRDDTTIVGGADARPDIEARCKQIRQQIETTASDYDREKLRERLAKLASGVAIIRVGGATETEVKERKDRVEDAAQAARAAIEEGIVAGGGVALLYATRALDQLQPASDDQRVGIDIVRRALERPVREIADNAGVDGSIVIGKLLDQQDIDYGFDAQSLEYRDLIDVGIVDPTKVVRLALQDAASIAGLLITTEVMVAGKPEESSQVAVS